MPLTRNTRRKRRESDADCSSVASVAAELALTSPTTHKPKKPRLSLPHSIASSTKITHDKVQHRRRTLRRKNNKVPPKDKENDDDDEEKPQIQSPTPYWKVLRERKQDNEGNLNTTPPETRSATKKKKTGGVLEFSPPNQALNAQREQERNEAQLKARAQRVQNARDNGQLLIFSPTMTRPAPLPPTPPQPEPSESIRDDDVDDDVEGSERGMDPPEDDHLNDNESTNENDEEASSMEDTEEEPHDVQVVVQRQSSNGEEISTLKSTPTALQEHENNSRQQDAIQSGLMQLQERMDALLHTTAASQAVPSALDIRQVVAQVLQEHAQSTNNSNHAAIQQVRALLEAAQSQNAELRQQLQTSQESLASLQATHDVSFGKAKESFQQELQEKEKSVQQTLEKLEKLASETTKWQTAAQELEAEVGALKAEQETTQASQSKDLETKIAKNKELTTQLKAAHEHQATLERALEETKQSLAEQVQALQGKLNQALAQIQELQTENGRLQAALDQANLQIQQDALWKDQVMATNDSNRTEWQTQRIQFLQQIKELQEQLKTAQEQRDDANRRMETFDARENDLFLQLCESDRVRRELHNKVLQLAGNIRVFVRVRPVLEMDNAGNADQDVFAYPGLLDRTGTASAKGVASVAGGGADDRTKNLLEVTEPYKDRGGLSDRRKKWRFGFDRVFSQEHEQMDIWAATEPLIQSAVDGYNVTLFAYGQTGSGKTFTMLGDQANPGLVSRSIAKLFAAKQEIEAMSRGESAVQLSVELLEIYNEKVRDLLSSNKNLDDMDLKIHSQSVVGNVVLPANDSSTIHKVLEQAQKRRCVKATAANAVSSRGHMIFTIRFDVQDKSKPDEIRSGRLHICDLAGSERLGKSHAHGSRLQETKHINTSLSVLSNVIEKLQAGSTKNIPYRESKLTQVLQNSLGGNSKTLAIVCCHPTHYHESLCSLRFAAKVNQVDLKAKSNFQC